nr:MAG TPA: hypothetical protein [Caudoviricetes sp.]
MLSQLPYRTRANDEIELFAGCEKCYSSLLPEGTTYETKDHIVRQCISV